jgi:hypothetical protein
MKNILDYWITLIMKYTWRHLDVLKISQKKLEGGLYEANQRNRKCRTLPS